jgi:hypothetical protein
MIPAGILASAHVTAGAPTYVTEVLADSPALWWRLGETVGAPVAADSSGNGRTGNYITTTTGTAGLVAGDADTAATFDGIASVVVRPYEAWQDDTTFTVEAIVKLNGYTSTIASTDGLGSSRGWIWYVSAGGVLTLIDAPVPTAYNGSGTLSTGTAYHVAMTADGSNLRFYIDGVLDSTFGVAVSAPTGVFREFNVGGTLAGGGGSYYFPFNGVMDELAYYPTALSGARILAHASAAGY